MAAAEARLAAEEAARDEAGGGMEDDSMGSYLVAYLIGLWSWGLMSPAGMQKIAAKSLRDLDRAMVSEGQARAVRAELAKLAGIGDQGRIPGNCNRDLNRGLDPGFVELWHCRFPLKMRSISAAASRWAARSYPQALILPHLLFSAMGTKYPKSFRRLICPSRDRLAQFWDNMVGNPQLEGKL